MTALKKVSDTLGLGENKGYAIAVFIALVFAAAVVTGYYLATRGPPEGYSTIYLLDSKGTLDFPETVVIGENNTGFNVQIAVENHLGKTLPFEVRLKITQQAVPTFPAEVEPQSVYTLNLENGGRWKAPATVTIKEPGNYMVVFELWVRNEASGEFEFTGNACVLNLEAVNQT